MAGNNWVQQVNNESVILSLMFWPKSFPSLSGPGFPQKAPVKRKSEEPYYYVVCTSGNTLGSHETVIDRLKGQISLEEVSQVDECDFILCFCTIVSRTGPDIAEAIKRIQNISDTKPAVLVVLHHTFDPDYVVWDSSRAVNRKNTITVDCLFHEDHGLLQCCKNEDSLKKITRYLTQKKEVLKNVTKQRGDVKSGVDLTNREKSNEEKALPKNTNTKLEATNKVQESSHVQQERDQQLNEKYTHIQNLQMYEETMEKRLMEHQKEVDQEKEQLNNFKKWLHINKMIISEKDYEVEKTNETLKNMKQELEASKNKVETQGKELQDKNRQLQEQKTELAEKSKQIEKKDILLNEREIKLKKNAQTLQTKDAALEEKEALLRQIITELEEKVKELEDSQRHMEDKNTQVVNMNKLLSEKETQLKKTDKELETSKNRLETLGLELQDKKRQLQEQKTEIAEKNNLLEEKESLLTKNKQPNQMKSKAMEEDTRLKEKNEQEDKDAATDERDEELQQDFQDTQQNEKKTGQNEPLETHKKNISEATNEISENASGEDTQQVTQQVDSYTKLVEKDRPQLDHTPILQKQNEPDEEQHKHPSEGKDELGKITKELQQTHKEEKERASDMETMKANVASQEHEQERKDLELGDVPARETNN